MTRPLPSEARALAAWLAEQPDTNQALLAAIAALHPSTALYQGRGTIRRPGTTVTRTLEDPRPGLLALMAAPLADRPGYRPEWADWVPEPAPLREIPPRPARPERSRSGDPGDPHLTK